MAETTRLDREIWRFKSSHPHNAVMAEWQTRILEVDVLIRESSSLSDGTIC